MRRLNRNARPPPPFVSSDGPLKWRRAGRDSEIAELDGFPWRRKGRAAPVRGGFPRAGHPRDVHPGGEDPPGGRATFGLEEGISNAVWQSRTSLSGGRTTPDVS